MEPNIEQPKENLSTPINNEPQADTLQQTIVGAKNSKRKMVVIILSILVFIVISINILLFSYFLNNNSNQTNNSKSMNKTYNEDENSAKLYLSEKYNIKKDDLNILSFDASTGPDIFGHGGSSATTTIGYNGKKISLRYNGESWTDNYQINEIWAATEKLIKDTSPIIDKVLPQFTNNPINEKFTGDNLISVAQKSFDGFILFTPGNENNKDQILNSLIIQSEDKKRMINLFSELGMYQDIIIYDENYEIKESSHWNTLEYEIEGMGGSDNWSSTSADNNVILWRVRYMKDKNDLVLLGSY